MSRFLIVAVVMACASASKPPIAVVASVNSGIDGVEVDDASIHIEVRDRKAHEIAVTRLDLVSCLGKHERLQVIGLELYNGKSATPVAHGARVTIPAAPAQVWSVHAKFPAFRAGECDDAYEADVVIDGVQRTYSIDLQVWLEESEE